MNNAKPKVEQVETMLGTQFEQNGKLTDNSPLKLFTMTCLYFGAGYSPPCQAFTPILIDFYEHANHENKLLQVIYVNDDISKEEFDNFYETMPWLAIPYGDERISKLKKHFDVKTLPELIVLQKNGEEITREGRLEICKEEYQAFSQWNEKIESDM